MNQVCRLSSIGCAPDSSDSLVQIDFPEHRRSKLRIGKAETGFQFTKVHQSRRKAQWLDLLSVLLISPDLS